MNANRKKESFKKKLIKNNLLLMIILLVTFGVYFFINRSTLSKYHSTYTAYDQLNKFYTNAKLMQDSFTAYIYNPSNENYVIFDQNKSFSYEHLNHVIKDINNPDIKWRFQGLCKMMDAYVEQSDIVVLQNENNGEINSSFDHLSYIYTLLNNTSADSYTYLTDDMQVQKETVESTQEIVLFLGVLILLYIIIWMVYSTIKIIKLLSNPIEKIIKNMNRIKIGEYDLTQISDTNYEMEELCLALSDMAKSVQGSMKINKEKADLEKRILEQQNENLKKDELLAQSELKVLQNQINPHFLFNTLNLIYKTAYKEHAKETSELMDRCSQLLRYGLDNANTISDLKSEVQAIQNYTFIQERRHSGRISFHMEMDANIPNIPMPSMILQPLIENAVSHGLKDIVEDGEVTLEITRQGSDLMITVGDNGRGMSFSELETLELNDFRIADDDRSHLGLYNVTKRMKAFFGDRVKILVNSAIDCGFEITLRIDMREGEDYGNIINN